MSKSITSNSCSECYKLSLYHFGMGEDFKDRLKRLLDAKNGGNQSELAEYVGVKPQSVQQWLAGKTQPNNKKGNLSRSAEFLGVTSSYLLYGDENQLKQHHANEYKVTKIKPNKKTTIKRSSLILNIIGRLEHLPIEDLEKVDLLTKNPSGIQDDPATGNNNGNGE